MADQLQIDVEQHDDDCVVRVRGEVDMATVAQLRATLAGVHVTVDMAGVGFFDSMGVGVLVHARNRLRGEQGDLTIRNPHDRVQVVLRTVGFADWIE